MTNNTNELAEAVSKLLPTLAAIFPAWRQAISTTAEADAVKREWYTALRDAGATPDEFRRGLSAARNHDSDFLPSCGKFLAWCQSERFPSPAQAWQQATLGKNENALVLEATRRAGSYDVKNRQDKYTQQLFTDHYADVIAEAQQGTVFSLPVVEEPKRIEAREPTAADKAAAEEARRKCYAMLDAKL